MDDVMLDENFVSAIKEDRKEKLKEECLKILNLNLDID